MYRVIAEHPLQLEPVEVRNDVDLQTEPGLPPCPGFLFHREWGGATNPYPYLLPGDHLIEARVRVNGDLSILKERFTVGICDFIPDIEMGL
jgi:hypothetical protein